MTQSIKPLLSPYSCYINLTNKCNLNCLHCLGDYGYILESELNFEEWKKVFDQLIENKVFYINISGGEPTVSPYFEEIIDYLSKKGLHFILTTNGVFSKKIRKIILKNKEYLIGIKISLDGYDAKSHNYIRKVNIGNNDNIFQITLNNIMFFKKMNIPITIATVIHKGNIKEFDKFINLIRSINPISWFISPIMPSGRGDMNEKIKENYYYYEKNFWQNIIHECNKKRINVKLVDLPFDMNSKQTIDYYVCGATITFCEINSDGKVSPCTLCRTIIPKEYLKFESLNENSLINIWNGLSFIQFRKFKTQGCEGCKAFEKCGKCVPQSFRYFKNGYSPTPYCIRNCDNLGLKEKVYYKQELIKQGIKL